MLPRPFCIARLLAGWPLLVACSHPHPLPVIAEVPIRSDAGSVGELDRPWATAAVAPVETVGVASLDAEARPDPAFARVSAELARDEPGCAVPTSVVSISRRGCFGPCPVYSVSMSSDGIVRYWGGRNAAVTGYATRTIDPETARRLGCELRRHGFFGMPPDNRRCRTDQALGGIRARIDGQTRELEDNSGKGPCRRTEELSWLEAEEAKIDVLARTEEWTRATAPGQPLVVIPQADAERMWRQEIAALRQRCLKALPVKVGITFSVHAFEVRVDSVRVEGFPPNVDKMVTPEPSPSTRACVERAVGTWTSALDQLSHVGLWLERDHR